MPTPRETLLVCFLGDPTAGSAELPRVVIEAADGRIEEVSLSPEPRRLLRFLALPRDAPLSDLTKRGSGNRLAESLAAPPPQRPIGEVEERLLYSRSQADRVRRKLQRELESQRLDGHLHRPRGWVGLRNGISDVALLFGAVRDERWDLAGRLLAIVAPGEPQGAQLLADEDWSPEARAHIADALAQAKGNFDPGVFAGSNERRPLPDRDPRPELDEDEEVLDGEIVGDRGTAVVLAGRRAVTKWPGRRRRLRRAALAAAFLLLAAGTAALAKGLLEPTPAPSPLQLSVKRAGPWPEPSSTPLGNGAALANLTREIPFGAPMAARTGDTLLAAVRLDVTRNSPWRRQPFEIYTSVDPSSPVEAGWNASFNGPSMPDGSGSGSATIRGLTARDRILLVPDSTVLLDDQMRVLRHLPDISLNNAYNHPYRLPHLSVGRFYYVGWRLQVGRAPDSAAGQISRTVSLFCSHPGRASINTEAVLGDVLECLVNLTNWGPGTLRDIRLHISWSPINPDQLNLWNWSTAPNADPRVAQLVPGLLNIDPPWPATNLEYIAGSNRLETRQGSFLSKPPGDPTDDGILIDELGPGLAQTRALRFKLRLIPGAGDPKKSGQDPGGRRFESA